MAGSYPPVPGPAAAATVAAVRRAEAGGFEVVVFSPRPSAAPLVMPVTGAAVGRALAPWGQAFAHVVVCMEPGWPLGWGRRPAVGRVGRIGRAVSQVQLQRAARSLAAALSGFGGAELVVTGDLGVGSDVLAVLWPAVDRVTASSEEVAAVLRASGAPAVTVVGPYDGAGLPRPSRPPLVGPVSPLEPAELLLVARSRRLIGSAARKVLGPRAPAVRAYLQKGWVRARLAVAGRRRSAKPSADG